MAFTSGFTARILARIRLHGLRRRELSAARSRRPARRRRAARACGPAACSSGRPPAGRRRWRPPSGRGGSRSGRTIRSRCPRRSSGQEAIRSAKSGHFRAYRAREASSNPSRFPARDHMNRPAASSLRRDAALRRTRFLPAASTRRRSVPEALAGWLSSHSQCLGSSETSRQTTPRLGLPGPFFGAGGDTRASTSSRVPRRSKSTCFPDWSSKIRTCAGFSRSRSSCTLVRTCRQASGRHVGKPGKGREESP